MYSRRWSCPCTGKKQNENEGSREKKGPLKSTEKDIIYLLGWNFSLTSSSPSNRQRLRRTNMRGCNEECFVQHDLEAKQRKAEHCREVYSEVCREYLECVNQSTKLRQCTYCTSSNSSIFKYHPIVYIAYVFTRIWCLWAFISQKVKDLLQDLKNNNFIRI